MAAFYIIFGSMFLIWAGVAFELWLRASQRTIVTTGTVTGQSSRWYGKGTMCLDVAFKDATGQEQLCRSSFSDMFVDRKVGSVVEVGYDPMNVKNSDLTDKNLSIVERVVRDGSWIFGLLFWLSLLKPVFKNSGWL